MNNNLNTKTISRASIINFLNAMVDEGARADDVVEMIEDVDEDQGKGLNIIERLEVKKLNLERKIERPESNGRDTNKFGEQLESVKEELLYVEVDAAEEQPCAQNIFMLNLLAPQILLA